MKILLATDGSTHARLAEEVLKKLPSARSAQILAASACAPPPVAEGMFDGSVADSGESLWDDVRGQANEFAEQSARRLTDAGFSATPRLLTGDVSSSLLELAREEGVDLIAVGSRGENAIEGFFLGSTARSLLGDSGVSVLVARTDQGKTAEQTIERLAAAEKLDVVLAYDGSDGAEATLEYVLSQGDGAYSRLTVVCAEPLVVLPFGMSPMGMPQAVAGIDDDRAEALVAGALNRLKGSSLETRGVTRLGGPAAVLRDVASEGGADLIALGASRHGFMERFLLGSVSFEVATSAPCSVLVVRPREA